MQENTITKNEFELQMVKSLKRDDLEYKAILILKHEGGPDQATDKRKVKGIPSGDLFEAMDRLKEYAWPKVGLGIFEKAVRDKKFGLKPAQKEIVDNTVVTLKKEIFITGISYKAKRDGITITCTLFGVPYNVKNINFANQDYGAKVQEICDLISDEVYEYAYNGKRHQLTLGSNEPEQESPVEKPVDEEEEIVSGKDKAARGGDRRKNESGR